LFCNYFDLFFKVQDLNTVFQHMAHTQGIHVLANNYSKVIRKLSLETQDLINSRLVDEAYELSELRSIV
jgi:hypothetical protein